jgi:hypothetical protein
MMADPISLCTLTVGSWADEAADVQALTGAHTRLVWVQDAGEHSDPTR